LYNYTKEDIANTVGEVIVFIKAFDDMFSNTVVARTSYTFNEIIYGAKYIPMTTEVTMVVKPFWI
jgi:hypothetical protein